MNTWARDLKIASNADRDLIDVSARELFIGYKRHRFTDVSFTVDLEANGALGLDTGDSVIDTWYDLVIAAREDGTDVTGMFVVKGDVPVLPDHYGSYEIASSHRNNGDGDLYRFKNAAGSNLFEYDEDTDAGEFVLLDVASVAAADTWYDLANAPTIIPAGRASRALLVASMDSVAIGLRVLRLKDKDLGNVAATGPDTIIVDGARGVGVPVSVGVSAAALCQYASNVAANDLKINGVGYEHIR